MNTRTSLGGRARAAMAIIAVLSAVDAVLGQPQALTGAVAATPPGATIGASLSAPPAVTPANEPSSVEQGQTRLTDSFEEGRQWRLERRRQPLEDTQFDFNFRSYYLDRRNFDGTQSQAWAIGGWAGLKTGYFLDHLALGATVYTSQKLYGDKDKDGTLLLEPGQQGYTVLGEAYADLRIIDDLNIYAGRKGFDTPYINRNDTRMTPNTFEAVVLEGKVTLGSDDETVRYGAGYVSRIKERNADTFIPMSVDAGATVDRGVYVAGVLYQKGQTSLGIIDYYCPDVINIGYAEFKLEFPINDKWKPNVAFQMTDQRSVGADLLTGGGFSGQQFGVKAELPLGNALFTTAYTNTTPGTNMQSPWSGYPGYTAVQVQDFNRAGEGALLLRASYEFPWVDGLSAYALWVHGTAPSQPGQYPQDECDLNLQWAPKKGPLKNVSLRLRYAEVDQHGGDAGRLRDFRAILNYAINF